MTELLIRGGADVGSAVADPWSGDVDGPLTCVEIVQVTPDVRSFTFALPGGAGVAFEPGQYLTFTFEVDGVPVSRCYTIASSPHDPTRPTITVKRVPGGPVSEWLHDRLAVGDAVWASGPFGVFSSARHPSGKQLFLSAGSGITPLMSMTRALRDAGAAHDVAFVHCARTPADIIFRSELAAIGAGSDVRVSILCEDDAVDEAWTGPRGRLSTTGLLAAAPDLLDREVFLCGPPPFMAAAQEMLAALGVDPARVHTESFLLEELTSPTSAPGAVTAPGAPDPGAPDAGGAEPPGEAPPTTRRVRFARSGREIDCEPGTPVLTAAARAGLTLPSSCGEGVCGTCKVTLLSGSVDMQHAGGIRPREIAAGQVLLCCSTPEEDLEIDA